jgi:hypothetical protein
MRPRAVFCVALLVAATVSTAGPAWAAGLARSDPIDRSAIESQVQAGYLAEYDSPGTPITLVATVTAPTLVCDAAESGVVTSVGMVEVPYRFAGARIYAQCWGGSATYEARLESSTGAVEIVPELVSAGDRLKISASWDGGVAMPRVTVKMINVDQSWRAKTRFEFIADGFNAAVVRQVPLRVDGTALPIADYAGADVDCVRVGGQDLDALPVTKYLLVDADGQRIVVPTRVRRDGRFEFTRRGLMITRGRW